MRGKKTTSNYLDSKRGETEGNLRKVSRTQMKN